MSMQINNQEIIFEYGKNQFNGFNELLEAVRLRLEKLNLTLKFIFKKREVVNGSTLKSTFQILK